MFGSPFDKLLIIAVLTSAAASTQTTILPTARTSLSMAAARALPATFARVHKRFQTPHISTIFGVISIVWYVGLTVLSEKVLFDSLEALGLMIAFYYGLTGFAAAIYYRHELFTSAKAFFAAGVLPVAGGLMLGYVFVKSAIDLAEPGNRDVFGLGVLLAIAIFFGILGLVLMTAQWINSPEFFRRPRRTAPPGSLSGHVEPESELRRRAVERPRRGGLAW